ncbi:ABC transporter permease subunit [Endozoicomonas sp. SM1973]|uniref:ABC transporter permease subunit n=1 Tax=Spartinivicinus marinus TaxID=2994442 RepID=A0A853I7Y2_9GAMM|nr:glycine betaine ABC transporter substrate-binding protein [Spartinivicinus marinus]MCX4025356.1 ABC transporter permease subunit [Spartinivicinus marinus]NYZ68929.1 ABC transporter permease subunit [Spartinivicinus marinus]
MRLLFLVSLFWVSQWALGTTNNANTTITVGSKAFNEGYLLGELVAQKLEIDGFNVERKLGLGKTIITYGALRYGDIDVYVEYTGTLAQAIFKLKNTPSIEQLNELAKQHELKVLRSLGFNNTYALVMDKAKASKLEIKTLADLAKHPQLKFGLTHEFIKREDGWEKLAIHYQLNHQPVGIEHGLAYEAIQAEKIDITDAYSTDGDIDKFNLLLLEDNDDYFPRYDAVPLVRANADPAMVKSLEALAGILDEATMQRLNGEVVNQGKTFAEVAHQFLVSQGLKKKTEIQLVGPWQQLPENILQHLKLTLIALIAACVLGIPLSIYCYRNRTISRVVIYTTGLLQTIPSIALLALFIPLFGIGWLPAVVALFLYSLMPIVRSTTTALLTIDPVLKQVAVGMGLTHKEQLRKIYLPLALPAMFTGIKTAAVINIGTATLAAFIGAGGLGEPIVTGLALNDFQLVLYGAVPAALLAVITELFFELVEIRWIPAHLRDQWK